LGYFRLVDQIILVNGGNFFKIKSEQLFGHSYTLILDFIRYSVKHAMFLGSLSSEEEQSCVVAGAKLGGNSFDHNLMIVNLWISCSQICLILAVGARLGDAVGLSACDIAVGTKLLVFAQVGRTRGYVVTATELKNIVRFVVFAGF